MSAVAMSSAALNKSFNNSWSPKHTRSISFVHPPGPDALPEGARRKHFVNNARYNSTGLSRTNSMTFWGMAMSLTCGSPPRQFRQRIQRLGGQISSRQFLQCPRHLTLLHATQRGSSPAGFNGTNPNNFQAPSSATVSSACLALCLSRNATAQHRRKRLQKKCGQLFNMGTLAKNLSDKSTLSNCSQLSAGPREGWGWLLFFWVQFGMVDFHWHDLVPTRTLSPTMPHGRLNTTFMEDELLCPCRQMLSWSGCGEPRLLGHANGSSGAVTPPLPPQTQRLYDEDGHVGCGDQSAGHPVVQCADPAHNSTWSVFNQANRHH